MGKSILALMFATIVTCSFSQKAMTFGQAEESGIGKVMLVRRRKNNLVSWLNKFIKTYQFPMRAKTNFAQCSPVRYMN